MPTMKISLGISRKSSPSIARLRRRAHERANMVATDQPELQFLIDTDFAEKMPLISEGESYVLEGPIPKAQNEPLFHRDGRENIRRGDDAEEAQVKDILAALDCSSQVLEQVAHLMATSNNPKHDITNFERTTGVDTRWIRRFVYGKQEQFEVDVDGESVTFLSHNVRTLAPREEPVHVLFTQPDPKLEGSVIQGRVDATMGDNRKVGVQKGGTHKFRLGLLEPWQAALLDCARHFQAQILVTADEAETTCGLKEAPVCITKVHNWAELLESALTELSNAARVVGVQTQSEEGQE